MARIGSNKGTPRLWIEGRKLLDAGWVRGTHFTVWYKMHTLELIRVQAPGERIVSGKGDRPIIDIVGKQITDAGFKIGDAITLNIGGNVIQVRKVEG